MLGETLIDDLVIFDDLCHGTADPPQPRSRVKPHKTLSDTGMCPTVSGHCRPLWSVTHSAKASSEVLRLEKVQSAEMTTVRLNY